MRSIFRNPGLRWAGITVLACVTFIAVVLVSNRPHREPAPAPAASSAPARAPGSAPGSSAPAPDWSATATALPDDVHVAWAYLDSTEGNTATGGDSDLHNLDTLVVPGLVADYLAHHDVTTTPDASGKAKAALAGDPDAVTWITKQAGDDGFARVVDVCALDAAELDPPRATALDTARYGACLREGAIIEPGRTGGLLDQMRDNPGGIGQVRGNDGGQHLAQFNSTTDAGAGRTRTGCLGVGAYWSAAVLVDYPTSRGAAFGLSTCAEVARTQFPPDTQTAPGESLPAASPSA